MHSLNTYQLADSSTLKSPFVLDEQDQENGLELIEEVDEPVELPKPKRKYPKKEQIDTADQQQDTVYGIENEESIPVRMIKNEKQLRMEQSVEKLFDPSPRMVEVSSWQIVVLVVSLLLLAFVKAFSSNRYSQSIKALMSYSVSQEINREEKVLFHRSNVLLTLMHLLVASLFIFRLRESIHLDGLDTIPIIYFLLIVGFLIAIYVVKYTFSKVLFFILNDDSIASEYIFNVSLYNNLLGVLLIPILCITYFSSLDFGFIFSYIAIPIVLLVFVLRILRLYIVGITKGISYFYIFLYICTLEILPLVVLYRIFILK